MKPRKPFKWRGRCWLSLTSVRSHGFPPCALWVHRGSGTAHAYVEVTIREVGKRKY
jgi:hypothetical protein